MKGRDAAGTLARARGGNGRSNSRGDLGFEATLWQAADKLRGNLDSDPCRMKVGHSGQSRNRRRIRLVPRARGSDWKREAQQWATNKR
jgi:hypothetical protein